MCARLVLALAAVSGAMAQSAGDRAALIDAVRHQALDYSKSLPDFLCTQVTQRFSAPAKSVVEPVWKLQDTLTIRLSYFDQKETYRVVQVNDKPANKSLAQVGGWKTRGDFGSMLRSVFLPKSQTAFEWLRPESWNGRPAAVIRYHIDQAHSNFSTTTTGTLRKSSVNWEANGLLYIDTETHQVLRMTVDSGPLPANSPMTEIHLVLDYAIQKIGEREFLLPARSVTTTASRKSLLKSETRFTDYRKFSSDAAISYR